MQGTLLERELSAGASRALRWADALRALRLCVRVQEAGWMWSGGFELDSPGDMFIKIRWAGIVSLSFLLGLLIFKDPATPPS